MKRLFPAVLVILFAGRASALEETISTDKNYAGHYIRNLPAPTVATNPARMSDVAPGACIPKSPGANTLPFICSVAETDYITPAYTLGGDLSGTPASANVIKLRETSGPTHLTIGAIADGDYLQRSGSTVVGTSTIAATSAPLATGAFGYGAAGLLTGDAANAHWDASNLRAGFRTSAPLYQLHLVDQAGATDRGLGLGTHYTGTLGSVIDFYHSRGTFASPSIITTGDNLGRINWWGYDGGAYLNTARISVAGTSPTSGSINTVVSLQVGNTGTPATKLSIDGTTQTQVGVSNVQIGGLSNGSLGGIVHEGGNSGGRLRTSPNLDYSTSDGTNTGLGTLFVGPRFPPSGIQVATGSIGLIVTGGTTEGQPGGIAISSSSATGVGATLLQFYNPMNLVGTRAAIWYITPGAGSAWPDQALVFKNELAALSGTPDRKPIIFDGISAVGGSEFAAFVLPGYGSSEWSNSSAPVSTSGRSAIRSASNKLQYSENGGAWANFTDIGSSTYAPLTRTLTAGAGMTGGGTLAADRTFDVVAGDATIVVNANDVVAGVMQTANIAASAVTTAKVADDAVTYAKMQNVSAASKLLGRGSASGAGDPQEITLGTGLSMSGTTLSATGAGAVTSVTATLPVESSGGATPDISVRYTNTSITLSAGSALQRAALTGDVTAAADSNATTIANNAVSNAKLRDSGALSVIGRNVNTSGDPADISASAGSDCVFRENGSTLACGTVATAGIADDAVTNAKLANMATQTFKGRTTAGTGDPEDLTATQATAMLNVFSSSLKGLVPAGGAAAGSFLKFDGTWAVPPGTGGGGTITGVTASLPLTSSGGTAPNIALNYDAATITLNGSNQIQRAALTGDVTASAGSNTTTIAAQAVIYSKIQNLATDHLLGRDSAGAGSAEEIALSTGLTFTGAGSIALANTAVTPNSYTYGSFTVDAQGRLTSASSGATPEVPLTFSTGLTRTSNTITANLSTGVSGGQSVVGGTASGNNLTLSSTSNATKGKIIVGSSAFNEATNQLGVGTTSPDTGINIQAQAATAGVGAIRATVGGATDQTINMFIDGTLGPRLEAHSNPDGTSSGNFAAVRLSFGGNGLIASTSPATTIGAARTWTQKLQVAINGNTTIASLGTGIVKSTSGLLANASASDIAAAQTWPAAEYALFSGGASSAPISHSRVMYDVAHDIFELSDDATQSWYQAGTQGTGNYARVRQGWDSGAFTLVSEKGGTATLLPMKIDAGTANLTLTGGSVTVGTLSGSGTRTVVADASGVLSTVSEAPTVQLVYYLELDTGRVGAIASANQYLATNSFDSVFASRVIEYPVRTTPTFGRVQAYVTGTNTITGGNMTFGLMKNGSGGLASATINGSSAGIIDSGLQLVSGTNADTYGLQVSGNSSSPTVSGTLRVTVVITLGQLAF